MKKLYSFFIGLTEKLLPVISIFSPKMKHFVQGRKGVFAELEKRLSASDKIIWFHAASLGEYEQGVPVMEAVKKDFPDHKILLTFFSPSGYEVKKNTSLADWTFYLPLDTIQNARHFMQLVRPLLAVFIKYEIWPNYLSELEKQQIKTILISGLFRENQVYFKPYGGFLKTALMSFDHIFVQDKTSYNLLKNIGIQEVSISGDTRFDRVSLQLEKDNHLDFIVEFKKLSDEEKNGLLVVCGSTWPEDEEVIIEYVNDSPAGIKFIFAPHNIKPRQIQLLKKNLHKKTLLYSEREGKKLNEYQVLIIDNIGLLSKIYSYADIAYVGGGMGKTGLHNILEPATFGVPILIGPYFKNFPEAEKLRELGGLFSVRNQAEFSQIMTRLISQTSIREKTGMICSHFVQRNKGATQAIRTFIRKLI